MKITPAHDFNDHAVGLRHGLVPLDVMTVDGRMNDAVPEPFRGFDRFEARRRAVEALEDLGLIDRIEPKVVPQPFGERSGVVLEPRITDQWFMKTDGLAAAAAEAVRSGETRFVPGNWASVFHRWMDNIEPWCISRQLWYGHQIPAWYGEDGDIFVAESAEEAEAAACRHYGRDGVALTRDPDILDTWFSSALWPFATLGWPDETPELARYYPQDLLVTGFDIIFFWVARMMMQSIHFEGAAPFRDIYMHGLVRDAQGQKMSKTKGNVIDPLDLIAQHGADATRMTMMILCGHGQDIRLSPDAVRPARLFANKLWNAARFATFNRCFDGSVPMPAAPSNAIDAWIVAELVGVARRTLASLDEYRFSDAATGLQAFVRDTFCDWYVEFSKISMNGGDAAAADETRAVVGWCLKTILQLLNPFMPFVTEALWDGCGTGDAITAAQLPDFEALPARAEATAEVEGVIALVSRIRSVRSELKVPPGKPVPLLVSAPSDPARALLHRFGAHIRRLANLSGIDGTGEVPEGAVRLAVDGTDYLLALGDVIDFAKERARLDKELAKALKDAGSVAARLADEAFVAKAKPEVIETNRGRLVALDAEVERLRAALALI